MSEILYGYCQCGCGTKTRVAPYNAPSKGWIRGEPAKYVRGHFPRNSFTMPPPNPSGLCMCGCGEKTEPYTHTDPKRGRVKGQLARFVKGHHLQQRNQTGDCDLPLEQAFWSRVDIRTSDECWEWQGCRRKTSGKGGWGNYGLFYNKSKEYKAHRIAYELTFGKIPDGTLVCHKCDNPPCCNPNHLFLGTCADNVNDMIAKGRGVTTHGSDNPNAKLTEPQVIEIRDLIKQGVTDKRIAELYHVSVYPISRIRKNKGWKHVKTI